MNLCQDHWDRLRKAIDQRGLTSLVGDGRSAHAKVVKQLENASAGAPELDKSTFDPLMNASIAIMSNCMEAAPPHVRVQMLCVVEGTERPPCPLCFINEGRYNAAQQAKVEGTPEEQFLEPDNKGHFDVWLEKAADEQREHAVRLGLLAQG